MARVVALEDIRFSPTASLFEGGDEAPLSIFVTEYQQGGGVGLHTHPYPEVFVVQAGTATFTIGDEELEVASRHIAIAPPETPHGFRNEHDDVLLVVSVHPSPRVIQTFL
jgi:quercetin dioxygenase-like cupin family protein